ncbi:MAG: anti-sigma factor [Sphingomonas sp.]|nr:anti-sigma factor [Sphingomonas sp.]
MMGVNDDMLMAYLDDELDSDARAAIEAALAADPALRDRLETQRRLRDRLTAHYGPVADEPVPERLRALLEPSDEKVVDFAAARVRRARPVWQNFAAIAATLVLGLVIGRGLPSDSGPIAIEDGMMVARGSLAEALDTQLASAQAPDATTRIGISFARADGSLCRTFDGADFSGLACREAQGWRVMTTAGGSGGQTGGYRQAGGAAIVLQAAQEMMAGEPFDADAERRARDADWRGGR